MKVEMNNKRLLGFKDIVEEFGITVSYWRHRVWARDIPFAKFGNKILIERRDIEAYIEKQKQFA
ncbi:MAG: helix-turn-helix domain-containing protein [Desulfobacterales bacterium]|nr:helix-turn-helix domain-containing protein [Desulfobacterales bacterium]